MFSALSSWAEDKATTYLRTGIQAGGTLAGNAVGGVGSLVESAGSSAGQTAKESIAGVGRYINGYGEGVRRSMAADGPGAVEVKKSAVKATTASGKRASPSVGAAKTTGVAAGGAQRLTASTTPKVVAALPPKPASMTTKPATRSGVPAVQKLQSTATSRARPKSNVAARGKTIISAASKPRGVVAVGAAIPGARSMRGLGAASVQTRKPTAADPLALGSNIGSIGEKK